MTNEQYEPIDESNYYRGKGHLVSAAVLVMAVATVMALLAVGRSHNREKPTMQEMVTTATIELESSSHTTVRDCTLTECYASNCNHEVAPFTCLFHNGGPHGGCSPDTWTAETCTEQCNLAACASIPIPENTESCRGVECTKEWCAGGQVCPAARPYQCVTGAARFGCSTDALQWTLRTDGSTCSSCCDATSCT